MACSSGEPTAPRKTLVPLTAVARLQGQGIMCHGGQQKSCFLFSFPGLLVAIASASHIRELTDLGTKNPVLCLDFPQVRNQYLG
jgi:hypothetical protein